MKRNGVWKNETPIHGTGFPEGVVSAPPGTEYIDDNLTNGAWKWYKEKGNGATGWKVAVGDTGWREVESTGLVTGKLRLKRKNDDVYYYVRGIYYGTFTLNANQLPATRWTYLISQPLGFRASASNIMPVVRTVTDPTLGYTPMVGTFYAGDNTDAFTLRINTHKYVETSLDLLRTPTMSVMTTDAWPSVLPGIGVS